MRSYGSQVVICALSLTAPSHSPQPPGHLEAAPVLPFGLDKLGRPFGKIGVTVSALGHLLQRRPHVREVGIAVHELNELVPAHTRVVERAKAVGNQGQMGGGVRRSWI